MSKEYIARKVFLESADFHILVLELPEDEINDKLALLASEKGRIYKNFYEDFVIGTCMSNSGPFFYHMRRSPELLAKFEEIRAEALELIYRHNQALLPDNIVINDNNILKTKPSVRPDESVRPLTENDLWNQDPPLSHFGPSVITNAPDKDDGAPRNPFLDDEDEDAGAPILPNNGAPISNPFEDTNGGGGNGNGDDVPYELVGHRWKKVGIGLNIRRYDPDFEDAPVLLLGGTPFETARGYQLLVVSLCIEDYADVFHLLDTMGVTKHTPPDQIVEELYEIAVSYNPFLKLENVDLKKVRAEYKKRQRSKARNRHMATAGNEDRTINPNKKRKFSDVPAETLLNLDTELQKHIVGQDEAVKLLAEAIQRASVGLKREHEPLGCFLFTGNTGVGKTETAKALAKVLDANLVRVDCQEYQQPHEVAKLTGSPPGYIGYDDGGHLTKEVAKNPFSIVLLDEIEKAHGNFHERVLQILDDGVLTESKGGRKVSFKQCFIIMTSNIGVKEVDQLRKKVGFGDVHSGTETKTAKARQEALKKKFKPEFLNRIDEVVHFRLLGKEDYLHILNILLDEVQDQLKANRGITLNLSAGAKNFLIDNGIDAKYGARPMRRAIKKYLNTPLAKKILKEELQDNAQVNIVLSKDRESLVFKQGEKKSDAVLDDSTE